MKRMQQAFTLVELSIVLVIIGLLVGGILVAQNMIESGRLKKQITQFEQYKTAGNTFRDKYNGLPGDLVAATANGFQMVTRTGAAGHGDGNGRVEGCSANAMLAGCEALLYWTDLTFTGLLSPAMTTATDALTQMAMVGEPSVLSQLAQYVNPIATAQAATREQVVPAGAINGNYVTVFTDGAYNFFQLTGIVSTTAGGVYSLSDQLAPMQAMSIDSKLDDGQPLLGSVRAVGGTGPLNVAAVPGAGSCVAATTNNPYNTVTDTLANGMLCQLRVSTN